MECDRPAQETVNEGRPVVDRKAVAHREALELLDHFAVGRDPKGLGNQIAR